MNKVLCHTTSPHDCCYLHKKILNSLHKFTTRLKKSPYHFHQSSVIILVRTIMHYQFNCFFTVVTCHVSQCHHFGNIANLISRALMNFKKFRTMLQGSSVELLSLITYLPSFTLFTGFLLNKELNTNCFSLPLNL